jgi:hypothetical protein
MHSLAGDVSRTRASAKAAGARFERVIADYLAAHIDDRIDRRVKTGSKDRGDIGGLRSAHGHRMVAELKDCARLELGPWKKEADTESRNDDAIAGVVIHKRVAHGNPGDQWVHMTVDDLIALITGVRP